MAILWFPLFMIIHPHLMILAADHPYSYCYSNTNSTSDSKYISSRDSQLLALADNVKNNGGYYSKSTITSPPAPVPNCLGLCRKDIITSDACYTCISNSASNVTSHCPVQKQVVAWGEDAGCIVQCLPPNTKLIPTQALTYICNTTTLSENYLSQFVYTLAHLTSRLAVQAANEGTTSFPSGYNEPQYFTTEEEKFSDHLTVYAAGFCVPSLSKSECTACLNSAANQSAVNCDGKEGAKIFMASCVLRYELFPFYKSAETMFDAPLPSVSPSPGKQDKTKRRRRGLITIVLVMLAFVTLLIFIIGISIIRRRKKQHWDNHKDDIGVESIESCLEFSFNTVRVATNDFSESNKLGEGGFGVVYKGSLSNGLLVAVKRLTRATLHGDAEFKNEIQLVARLHHKNLVRLLGFCFGLKERILIYELAPNGSLDRMLFDSNRRENLTWMIRYNIIQGIAHGLLYLHEESQLRIIHRDLKAGNVLLDDSMNPKISDFGTARLFFEDQGSASKIVGTYGYMPPEYAKFGKISTKVDVFSFGVLFLEIISGRKNNASFDNPRRIDHLLSKAWKCWTTRQLQELIDPILLRESGQSDHIVRCIHIGLLCVQEKVASRPTMSEVVLALEGCSQILPPPSQPAYLMEIDCDEPSISTTEGVNELTRINNSVPDQPTCGLISSSSAGVSSINEVSFTHTYPEPR